MANLYDKASLVMIPSQYKDGSLYNIKPLKSSFEFERGSISTRINKDGLIENVSNDTPRLDYSGTEPSLLLEPQRTNLVTYSNFKSGEWNGFDDATLENNYGISPDGTRNSTRINAFGGASDFVYDNTPISNGVEYTTSFFVKNIDATRTEFWTVDTTQNVRLDWNGSEITDSVNCTFEDFGNGWYRVQSTETSNTTSYITRIYPNRNATGGVEVYGYQVEQGSYATSYIPTNGQAETRLADGTRFNQAPSNIFNQDEFTLFIDVDITSDTANNFMDIVAFRGNSNTLRFETRTNNEVRVQHSGMYTSGNDFNSQIIGDVGSKKFAMTFTNSQVKFYTDGSLVGTYNGVYSSDLHSLLFVNSLSSGVETKINLKQYVLFPEALTDTELQTLTTI